MPNRDGRERTSGERRAGKVLIADDERVEREGLRAILLKHLPGLAVELAKNGAEAVAKAEAFRPDLVLMDIKMPGLNGLEAVAQIKRNQPDVQFAMVTAYDEFAFARRALQYGVKDYLLKPSRTAETVDTVRRLLDDIAAERAEREERSRRAVAGVLPVLEADMVTQLLHDHQHEVKPEELAEWLGGLPDQPCFVMALELDGGDPEAARRFHAALRERLRTHRAGWAGALSGRHIPLILFCRPGFSHRAVAASLFRRILQLAGRHGGLGLAAGIGRPRASLADVRPSWQEALAAAGAPAPARCRFYEDMPARREPGAGGEPDPLPRLFPGKETEAAFIDHVRTGRWARVEETAMACADRWEKGGFPLVYAAQRMLELLWLVSRIMAEAGAEAPPPAFSFQMTDYRALRGEARCELGKLVREAEAHARKMDVRVVERVKRTIRERSHEDLSLERIAAEEGVSPFHLSRLFKEETGVNYIDFLTACRMEKARALLGNPALSLKQIAYEVGYRDPNYFSRVFKRTTGVSPRDYRRRRMGGEGADS